MCAYLKKSNYTDIENIKGTQTFTPAPRLPFLSASASPSQTRTHVDAPALWTLQNNKSNCNFKNKSFLLCLSGEQQTMPKPKDIQGCKPSETWRGLTSPCSYERGPEAGSVPLLCVVSPVPRDRHSLGFLSGCSPAVLGRVTWDAVGKL